MYIPAGVQADAGRLPVDMTRYPPTRTGVELRRVGVRRRGGRYVEAEAQPRNLPRTAGRTQTGRPGRLWYDFSSITGQVRVYVPPATKRGLGRVPAIEVALLHRSFLSDRLIFDADIRDWQASIARAPGLPGPELCRQRAAIRRGPALHPVGQL